MGEICDSGKILLDSIERISFSASCRSESWAGQTKVEYTCQTKVVQFSKNDVFSQDCHFLEQYGMLLCSVVRSQRPLFNGTHCFKHIALLKRMLHVNDTAYLVQK